MPLLGSNSHDRRMILRGAAFASLLLLPMSCTAIQFVYQADKRQMAWLNKAEKRWQQLAELSFGFDPEMTEEEREQVEVAVSILADDPKRSADQREMLRKLKDKLRGGQTPPRGKLQVNQ